MATALGGNKIALWYLEEEPPAMYHPDVAAIEFDASGKVLVSVGSNSVRTWDTQTGQLLFDIPNAHTGNINDVVIESKKEYIVSASGDNSIKIWDLQDGSLVQDFPSEHLGAVLSLDIDPAGVRLASVSDKMLKIWDLSTMKVINSIELDFKPNSVAFSSDGKMLAVGGKGANFRVFDSNTFQLLGELNDEVDEGLSYEMVSIWAVGFKPDANILGVSSIDGIIRFWDTRTFEQFESRLNMGEGNDVWDFEFSPGGSLVAGSTYGYNDSVKLFEFGTFTEIGLPLKESIYLVENFLRERSMKLITFDGFDSTVEDVEFSPDGQWLASAAGNYVAFWNIDPNYWAEKACQVAGRNLTLQEWQTYFGNEPYQITCSQWPVDEDALAAKDN